MQNLVSAVQLPRFELLALIHFIVSGGKNIIFKTCLIQNTVADSKLLNTKASFSPLTRKGAQISVSYVDRLHMAKTQR